MSWLRSDRGKGTLFVLISTTCYGFMPVFTQLAFQSGMHSITVIMGRFGLANLLYLAHLRLLKVSLRVSRRQLKILMWIGVVGAASSYSMNESFRHLPSGIASVMIMTYVIVIVIFEMCTGKEKVFATRLVCLALAFAGILVILWSPGESSRISPWGILTGFLGAAFYAATVILQNHEDLRPLHPEVIFFYESLPLLASAVVVGLWNHVPLVPAEASQWVQVGLLAVFNSFIAMVVFLRAVRLIGASSASLIGTMEPLISCLAGAWLMHDVLTARSIVGGLMIVGAIFWLNLTDRRRAAQTSEKESIPIE